MSRPWLVPLVPVYAAGLVLRDLRIRRGWEQTRRLRWPVVSIGNLSTGGAGKTPLTIALARLLTARGFHVDVLSRGYGRTTREAARVRHDGTAAEFGDEPLLIAREAGVPVYVAPQRYDAGLLAEAEQQDGGSDRMPRVHILDDGFQHRQLGREVNILLLSESDLHDMLLPAGNLREPLRAMRRANVIAVPDLGVEEVLRRRGWPGIVWRLKRRMDVPVVGGPVVAFCGIARPAQFFAGIEASGVRIAASKAFRDHHVYTESEMRHLLFNGRKAGAAAFITTQKDLLRLGPLASTLSAEMPLKAARLEIEIKDARRVIDGLVERLAARPSHQPL
jgi:tetraacyldisaccharide 4'-kinase